MKEERIDRYLRPVEGFMHAESTGGIVLLLSALAAIIWSNSPWSNSYFELWEYEFSISFGEYGISKSFHHWINDGLMAMFFFVVGLELKREIIAGELSDFKKAILPITAAVGGMLLPGFDLSDYLIHRRMRVMGGVFQWQQILLLPLELFHC